MKFLDEAKIYLASGHGGAGCLSFRREKYIEFGGPNGGNGGRGGDVIFVADDRLNTLIDFRYQQHYKAKSGRPGMGNNRTGAGGDDCIIKVPVGTQILDEDKETVLADFTDKDQILKLLKGGDGGFGNAHYKSSTNQAPRKTTPGWPGQEMTVWLRLKLIADVGLLGLPNTGKSTFLASCSNARPKIADYPFTTLHPNLGVVKAGEKEYVFADIPGLIEGASEGHGLGDRFLGHIERTSTLLHLIDITAERITDNYDTIIGELEAYGHGLMNKPQVIALNKCDALSEEEITKRTKKLEKHTKQKIFNISAVSKQGVKELLFHIASVINEQLPQDDHEESEKPWEM